MRNLVTGKKKFVTLPLAIGAVGLGAWLYRKYGGSFFGQLGSYVKEVAGEKTGESSTPDYGSAITATTGGSPEDMNGMPPTGKPGATPNYDGSDLGRGRKAV